MKKLTNEQAWSFAIGIVQTEGHKPSEFMLDLIQREKSGDISADDIDRILIEHYTNKGA